MKSYFLRREQLIPRPLEEVFAFFADAKNLEAITPSWLGFHILSTEPLIMRAGTHIIYRLHWHWLPIHWVTEIRTWEPPHFFVDFQLRGPYKLWHHTHTFQSVEGGTLMHDVVEYALPLGFLGRLAHRWKVKADLNAIFDYRAAKVADLLGVAVRP